IEDATPHIYLSAIPFIPAQSILKDIWPVSDYSAKIFRGLQKKWPNPEQTINFKSSISCVTFSPGGQSIAAAVDHNLYILNATSGKPAVEPLTGHTSYVISVAFSPDGQRIVSGSYDKTIRIWDAQTGCLTRGIIPDGKVPGGNLEASPDIVSGSDDKTIRIWDAQTGTLIGDPLTGLTSGVSSVAFSPDGQRIVSGSYNKTIRIWD
ncbi:hypothetical protein M422DRAFT_147187, partial [Sphaerobolus stellatus SS14]